ncbi:cytochrome b5 [Neoconidiobolus thromboides FSU 785]|nr:cytochrome b5 [Neoconidiobolus thromboides FSU 785]
MSKVFTKQEVSAHSSDSDLYLIVNGNVYDVTKFIQEHPGGEEVLLELGGQDATEAYLDIGHSESADKLLESYKVGTIDPDSEVNIVISYQEF